VDYSPLLVMKHLAMLVQSCEYNTNWIHSCFLTYPR